MPTPWLIPLLFALCVLVQRAEAAKFESGFGLLADLGLSFDLQCAPAQLLAAAALFGRHPKVPVAICKESTRFIF